MTRKVGIVTTSRADLSPLRSIMAAVDAHPDLALEIYVTGMHLADGFGASMDDIRASGYPIVAELPSIDGTGDAATALAIGTGVSAFARFFASHRPDILLVLGDRYDMMPAVLAALPFRLPVAHVHGGEVTLGAMDDCIRHAVSKLSHLHFVAVETFARRLRQLGEEPGRIFVVGAPGLDNLADVPRLDRQQIHQRFGLPVEAPYILATLHPETLAALSPTEQAQCFATALEQVPGWVVLTAPNADPGHDQVRAVLIDLARRRPKTLWLENAGPEGYPNLLRLASCVVGNSSSGIIEAGFFQRPVVNVGRRQTGRPTGENVVSVDWSVDQITSACHDSLSELAATRALRAQHPYGNGGAARRIAEHLAMVPLDTALTCKLFMDQVS